MSVATMTERTAQSGRRFAKAATLLVLAVGTAVAILAPARPPRRDANASASRPSCRP